MNKHPILTGLLGGCITVIVVFIIILISHKQQQIFNPVYIVTSQYKVNNPILNNIKNNEVKDKLAEVERLNEKGVILTPQEYTSHISTFYNNIIAVLIALLAIFSIVTYLHFKFLAKEEVQNQVKDLMRNSPEIQRIISENVSGKIEDVIYSELNDSIVTKKNIKNYITELKNELSIPIIEDESELSNLKVKKG